MTWRSRILTCFTLTILLAAVLSILRALDGDYLLAARLIILAGVLDGLDGSLARRVGGTTDFGARLDTYVDTVSFGVAPAVLTYLVICRGHAAWGTLLAIGIVGSGVLRFTRGCELPCSSGKHCFRGLPIPVSGVWIALFALMIETNLLQEIESPTGRALVRGIMWSCTVLFLFLQVSSVPYTKPKKEILAASMALTLVLMLAAGRPWVVLSVCMGLCLLAYVTVGPFLARYDLLADDAEEPEPSATGGGKPSRGGTDE